MYSIQCFLLLIYQLFPICPTISLGADVNVRSARDQYGYGRFLDELNLDQFSEEQQQSLSYDVPKMDPWRPLLPSLLASQVFSYYSGKNNRIILSEIIWLIIGSFLFSIIVGGGFFTTPISTLLDAYDAFTPLHEVSSSAELHYSIKHVTHPFRFIFRTLLSGCSERSSWYYHVFG